MSGCVKPIVGKDYSNTSCESGREASVGIKKIYVIIVAGRVRAVLPKSTLGGSKLSPFHFFFHLIMPPFVSPKNFLFVFALILS